MRGDGSSRSSIQAGFQLDVGGGRIMARRASRSRLGPVNGRGFGFQLLDGRQHRASAGRAPARGSGRAMNWVLGPRLAALGGFLCLFQVGLRRAYRSGDVDDGDAERRFMSPPAAGIARGKVADEEKSVHRAAPGCKARKARLRPRNVPRDVQPPRPPVRRHGGASLLGHFGRQVGPTVPASVPPPR